MGDTIAQTALLQTIGEEGGGEFVEGDDGPRSAGGASGVEAAAGGGLEPVGPSGGLGAGGGVYGRAGAEVGCPRRRATTWATIRSSHSRPI